MSPKCYDVSPQDSFNYYVGVIPHPLSFKHCAVTPFLQLSFDFVSRVVPSDDVAVIEKNGNNRCPFMFLSRLIVPIS